MAKAILRVSPSSGDPKNADSDLVLSNRGPIDQSLDVRDRLAELIGKGNVLNPDDKSAIFGSLVATLGRDKAAKVMNHAYIFNQRPDVAKLPLEDKIKAFYTIGSNDPDVNQIIGKSKSLGYGVLPGFREGSSAVNQLLAGRVSAPVGATDVSPEIQKKVMVRIGK